MKKFTYLGFWVVTDACKLHVLLLNIFFSSYGTRVDYIYCNQAALALWQCKSLTNIGNFSVEGSDSGSHSALSAVFLRTEESVMG